jgi:hypothetical protein
MSVSEQKLTELKAAASALEAQIEALSTPKVERLTLVVVGKSCKTPNFPFSSEITTTRKYDTSTLQNMLQEFIRTYPDCRFGSRCDTSIYYNDLFSKDMTLSTDRSTERNYDGHIGNLLIMYPKQCDMSINFFISTKKSMKSFDAMIEQTIRNCRAIRGNDPDKQVGCIHNYLIEWYYESQNLACKIEFPIAGVYSECIVTLTPKPRDEAKLLKLKEKIIACYGSLLS